MQRTSEMAGGMRSHSPTPPRARARARALALLLPPLLNARAERKQPATWTSLKLATVLWLLAPVNPAAAQNAAPPAVDQSAPSPSPEAGGRLELTCVGGGSANKIDFVDGDGNSSFSGSAIGPDGMTTYSGSSTSSGSVAIPRAQSFADQMDLFIEKGEGRVRVPRVMLPPIRGGENGWFKLKNVAIAPNEITASVAINLMNNPKLRIDRRTGVVNLSGKAGDFVGRCQKAMPQAAERQF